MTALTADRTAAAVNRTGDERPPAVELRNVSKTFGTNTAVDGVDLSVADGEFLTLLGPSGCGKTTLLSMLAGFVTADEGTVLIAGRDMTHVPPYRRPVNTVFQDYALFPHMNVLENVAFGLRMEGVAKQEARRRAADALGGVDLEQYAGHRVEALSGGQRQRVALARALVKQPKVLLLDEPFAALDLQLRRKMQLELRQLHRESGTTFVFVTHDQEEASVLSDRVAVLRDGHVQQVGAPEEIYDDPQTRFVAEFIGESNVFDAVVTGSGQLEAAGLTAVPPPSGAAALPEAGTEVAYAVRPERVRLVNDPPPVGPDSVVLEAHVREVMRVGEMIKIIVQLSDGTALNVAAPASADRVHQGDRVSAVWDRADGRVLLD